MKHLIFMTTLVVAGSVLASTAGGSASDNFVFGKKTLYLTETNQYLDVVRLVATGKGQWNFSFDYSMYTANLKTVEQGHLYGMYKGSKKNYPPDMTVNMSVKGDGSSIVYTIQNMTAPNAPLESILATRVQADTSPCVSVADKKFCVGDKTTVSANGNQLIPRIYDIQQLYFNDSSQAVAFKDVTGTTPIAVLSSAHVVDLKNPSVRCAKPGVCIGDSVSFRTNNLF